jgi:pre-mRNA-splicing helicase BRR2
LLHDKEFEALYSSSLKTFNKIKTICAEFALLRLWSKAEQPRTVCIEPFPEVVEIRVAEWRKKFGQLQGGKEIVTLTGETSADLCLLEKVISSFALFLGYAELGLMKIHS